jgi:predicted acyl esterase
MNTRSSGFTDFYRDPSYHGGILCEFMKRWAPIQALTVQYGLGERARKNPNTGESVGGPITRSDEELAKHRANPHADLLAHPLDDAWHRARSADLSKITIPFLSCANWGGQGIHPRGNFNGFTRRDEAPGGIMILSPKPSTEPGQVQGSSRPGASAYRTGGRRIASQQLRRQRPAVRHTCDRSCRRGRSRHRIERT